MLPLILTICCSLAIAVLLKFNESRKGERVVVAAGNYVVAGLLGLLMGGSVESIQLPIQWMIVALLVGVGFVAGFMLQMYAIGTIGLAIPISIARIATLVPVIASAIIYGEYPSPIQIAGIVAGVAAFVMLGLAQSKSNIDPSHPVGASTIGLLLLILVVMGANDFSMKIAQESAINQSGFLCFVFGFAGIICWGIILMRRVPITLRDLLLGALLGVPNFFSSWFLVKALGELSASVVFPVVSAGGVILATLTALLFWKEYPTRAAWIGIALSAVAVALIGLGT